MWVKTWLVVWVVATSLASGKLVKPWLDYPLATSACLSLVLFGGVFLAILAERKSRRGKVRFAG
jgi:hypothetical protein